MADFVFLGRKTSTQTTLMFSKYTLYHTDLSTYATKYFSCGIFFSTLHTVCFMHGLSIYEINRICHRTCFFAISYGSFQHLTNFLKIWKNNISSKYRAKTVVIFSQLKLLPMTSTLLENVQVLFLSNVVTRYCMIYFGNSWKIGICFLNKS